MKKAMLTDHARDRLASRMLLSEEEFLNYLDHDEVVDLGVSSNSQERIIRLLYSPNDENFFVIIQDLNSWKILSLMPLSYWNVTRGKRITNKDMSKAYTLSTGDGKKELFLFNSFQEKLRKVIYTYEEGKLTFQFKFVGKFDYISHSKKHIMGSYNFYKNVIDMNNINHENIISKILEKVCQLKLNDKKLICFYVSFRKSEPILLNINNINELKKELLKLHEMIQRILLEKHLFAEESKY